MLIAICDDDKNDRDKLKELITSYCKRECISFFIDCFSSGKQFLQAEKQYHILFMDIYLEDTIGTEIVKKCNGKLYKQCVFTTTSTDYAVEAYELNAVHYLIKPLTQEKIDISMQRCISANAINLQSIIQIKSGGMIIPVHVEDIIFIESMNKQCVIHTNNDSISTYCTLESLFEQINDDRFIKAQRSYLVNMEYIEAFFSDKIKLKDGTEIVLSRISRAELKEQFQAYLFRIARRSL